LHRSSFNFEFQYRTAETSKTVKAQQVLLTGGGTQNPVNA
jgi:hypothetical protein